MSHIEKFWVSATSEHVTRVMNGVTVEARFRDGATERWIEGLHLGGWTKDNRYPWLDESRSGWTLCQVYAPPQWFLDKPDPGEGYRLLGKFPDEAVQGGDFMKRTGGDWHELANGCNPIQQEGIWYRRKIEPPKPEPKHYVLRVGDTVETPSGHLIKIVDRPTEQMHYTLQVGDTCDVPSGHRIAITEHGVEVT